MKNTCFYSEDVVNEYIRAYWRDYFKKIKFGMLILFVVSLGLVFFSISHGKVDIIVFIPTLLLILMIPVFQKREKESIKNELKRLEVIFGENERPTSVIQLNQNNITVESNKNPVRECSWAHVKKYIETEHLIVLLLEGQLTLPLDKNGFAEGSAEECKALLNEKLKRKKK